MTYELAKELKDAGFPQITKHGWDICIHDKEYFSDGEGCCRLKENMAASPTLSELIEACGLGFRNLCLHSDGSWTAKGAKNAQGKWRLFGGHNAEGAVAKLWLALNKKHETPAN
jgi:hypothetical protein